MPATNRYLPSIIGAMTTLLIVVGCGQGNRESSAGGDVARDTSVVGGAPAVAQPIQPATMDLDDAEGRIEKALRADSTLGAFRLDADDERGGIVLEGVVSTEAQKRRAAEIATGVAPGVTVDNQLRVDAAVASKRAADNAADDAEDRIEKALDADPTLRAFDLDADDDDGRVVLKGTVQTAAQRTQAEEIAKRLADGVPIDNQIRVRQ